MRNKEVFAWLGFAAVLSGCQPKPSQVDVIDSPDTRATQESPETAQAEVVPEKPPEPVIPKVKEPFRVAFDLVANKPLAHRFDPSANAYLVDASGLDFVRYIHGNHPGEWSLDVDMDGRKGAALSKKRIGKIWAPSPVEGEGIIAMDVFAASKTKLKLEVNSEETEEVALEEGWQKVEFASKSLKGENEIRLIFSGMGRIAKVLSGGGLASLSIGAKASETAPLALEQAAIQLSTQSGLSYHLWALKESKLAFSAKPSECDLKLEWFGEKEGGVVSIGVETLDIEKGLDSYVTPPVFDEVVRLHVQAAGECEGVELQKAELVVEGAPIARPDVPKPKRIVFWLIDTLRADYLPIHFETNVRAPNLKRLAAEGASFKLAYVQGNESKTSHASLFSAMYPSKHGVVGRGSLKPHHEIMSEAIKAQGYKTLASVSNGYVSGPWGFEQGWDFYKNNIRQELRIDGKSMAKEGLEWSIENAEKPFFLYLGTIDPHVTYREHEDIIGNYDTTPYSGRFKRACYGEDLGLIKNGSLKVTERDKERITNLYKNEIEFNDRSFGELRAGLEEAGLWEDTMVVVTSDHGDEFWEHGSVGHGHSLYQDQVHVPFIVYYPPLIPAGTVVEAGVDVLDMYPTIVDAMRAERPENLQGKSVLPLVFKEHADYPEPSIATQYKLHYAMQMQEWKLYLRRGEYQLYDRKADSLELKDVAKDHPLASRWLLDSMGWFRPYRTEWDKQSWGVASRLSPEFLELASKAKRN